MKNYSDYVEGKYKEWMDKYNIPDHMEFQLKTMFELEEQFRNEPDKNVKTKRELLNMINQIYSRLSFGMFKEGWDK